MKKVLALLLALVTAFSMVACGGETEETKGADEELELFCEERTLNVAVTSEPTGFDPYATLDTWASMMFVNIYDYLLEVDEDGKIVPMLAESYEALDDKTYEFKLKQGIKFQNGEEMKASDVVFSFERNMKAEKLMNLLDVIESVEATDDYTVVFHLKSVSAPFISNITSNNMVIYSEKAVTEAGDNYYKQPIGTGPYKLKEWKQGQSITLEYWEGYHGDVPDFTTINIRPIPEATSRAIELESGAVDFITEVAATDYSRLQDGDGLGLEVIDGLGIRFLGCNCSVAPLDDVRVRQAIAYAVDAQAIADAITMGKATVAGSPVAPAILYHTEAGKNEFNLEKSKELLAEAGYPDGLNLTLSTDTRKEYDDVVTILQQQLAKANINVTLDTTEWAVFLDKTYQGDTQLFMLGYTCNGDPDSLFYHCFHSSMVGVNGGQCFCNDAEVDELLDAQRLELDQTKRGELFEKLQARLAELKGWIPLYNTVTADGINTKKVSKITLDPNNVQRFYKIWMVK